MWGLPAIETAGALFFKPRRDSRVITSYSIHYTKLYEQDEGGRRVHRKELAALQPEAQAGQAADRQEAVDRGRAGRSGESYNFV